MKLLLAARRTAPAAEARIVFVQDNAPLTGDPAAPLTRQLCAAIEKTGFRGACGDTLTLPSAGTIPEATVILGGLGATAPLRIQTLERATAAAIRAGKAAGVAAFSLPLSAGPAALPEPQRLRAAGRGALWGAYRFDRFKTSGPQKKQSLSLTFTEAHDPAACRRALAEALIEGTALCDTADLANLPGNEATPQHIAAWARKMARRNGLTCSVLGEAALQKKGCRALLSVAAGSAHPAQLITLRWPGTRPGARPVVLIGKTVTFDSGGISLKPGKGMSWMLFDKSGGMAVLAAMQMIAQLKPAVPVIGMLAAAENMPGSRATRPGDILRAHSGKTIEVLNTDAEGRLALADALSLAQQERPAAIVDIATLTGAVITALGHSAAAVLGNQPELTAQLIRSAEASGERLWELPLWPEHLDDIKGTFADLQNISKSGTAGTISGAAFLSAFVPDSLPWAHLDIAGTAWEESAKPWMDPGATLFGARTLVEWIRGL